MNEKRMLELRLHLLEKSLTQKWNKNLKSASISSLCPFCKKFCLCCFVCNCPEAICGNNAKAGFIAKMLLTKHKVYESVGKKYKEFAEGKRKWVDKIWNNYHKKTFPFQLQQMISLFKFKIRRTKERLVILTKEEIQKSMESMFK